MISQLERHEEVALWAVVAIGVAALICFVWNVTFTEAEPPDPPPVEPLSGDQGRGLAELSLAPEANANNIGVRLASEGKLKQAIESFRYALQQDRDYLPGHKNLLAALVESRRWVEALAAAREAEAVHPLGHYLTALTAEGDSRLSLAEDDHRKTRPGGSAERQTANGKQRTASTAEGAESAEDGNDKERSGVPGELQTADGKLRTASTAEGDSTLSLARGATENGTRDADLHRSRPMDRAKDVTPAGPDGPSSAVISVDQRESVSNEAVGLAAVGPRPRCARVHPCQKRPCVALRRGCGLRREIRARHRVS
jgi:hypothetical protein